MKKKVMIFGTFDIVHAGHIHMFKQAHKYGDHLVVSVARDANTERIKGEKPLHNEQERLEFLKNIKQVDEVILGCTDDPYKNIDDVKPDVIALGYDQKIYVDNLAQAITDLGLEIPIVRLEAYEPHRFKSRILRKYIEHVV